LKGQFTRRGPYGTFVATDPDGTLVVEHPQPPTGSSSSSRSRITGPTGRAGHRMVTFNRSRRSSPPSWSQPGRWGES
jgi:hypothetical protein